MRVKSKSSHRRAAVRSVFVESLEGRLLFYAGPVITSVVADNRGEATMQASETLYGVSNSTVQVFIAGASGNPANPDHVLVPSTVTFDVSVPPNQIVVDAKITPGTSYEVVVKSGQIVDANNLELDGEYNGPDVASGNGVAGGAYRFVATTNPGNKKVAVFDSTEGQFEVDLMSKTKDATIIANFLKYANKGLWDGIFVNRSLLQSNSVPNSTGIIQSGDYTVVNNASIGVVPDLGDFVPQVDKPLSPFTISMQMVNGEASNTFFFNTADNSAALSGEGYSSFGTVDTSQNSVADLLVTTINVQQTANLSSLIGPPAGDSSNTDSNFTTVPYIEVYPTAKRVIFTKLDASLIFFSRVSIANIVSAAIATQDGAAAAVAPANDLVVLAQNLLGETNGNTLLSPNLPPSLETDWELALAQMQATELLTSA